MKLRLRLHFFQPQNSFKGAKHWRMNVSVQPFQTKIHAALSIFLAPRLPPNTKLSPRELHMNVEINSQAQDKLPQRGFTCYVTKRTLHISCAWRRQRTPPPPPTTSGVWMLGGGGEAGGKREGGGLSGEQLQRAWDVSGADGGS